MLNYIKSDLCRYVGKDNVSLKNFIKHYIFNTGFKFCVWLRIAKYSNNRFIKFLAKIQHFRLSRKYMLEIPIPTNIGYGLGISHGKCVIVNATAILGNNVTLCQFSTIGSNHDKAATIGDNVYIGPSVCVVENVTIGSNVKIGAGAVVVKDIPSNTTAAGVPAKVLNINQTKEDRCRWDVTVS